MCGSYVHGRSWKENGRWNHFCKPYEINSHGEMPGNGSGSNAIHYQGLDDAEASEIKKLISVQGDGVWAAVFPLDYIDTRGNRIFIHHIRFIDSQPTDMMATLVSQFKTVDWGIQPWDGKVAKQRGNITDYLRDRIAERHFLPPTRPKLIEWTRNHWGKRGDGDEFTRDMTACLNYDRLKSQLPENIRKLKRASGRYYNYAKVRERADIRQEINGYIDAPEEMKLQAAIKCGSDPCERFVSMFKDAPNEFWMARN